ncbi:MAG: ribosome-associated translation inhibitor RaiA [Clostridiales bacterium]|nr:ribosome-associated translation inhibitor RaiA [Clostridiales bacterium]
MKINITSKNFTVRDDLKDTITSKLVKLGKYFSDEVEADVTVSLERGRQKIETTIAANGMFFRAEDETQDPQDLYNSMDRIADKLAGQISKYKTKLTNRHQENKSIRFEDIPDYTAETAEEDDTIEIARRKRFDLLPMTEEEAVLQMELVGHSFFVFLNMDTDSVSVVYKRKGGTYGLLEPSL